MNPESSEEPSTGLSILSHTNPVHITLPYLSNIHFKIILNTNVLTFLEVFH
jgi:hypothetical protein